MIKLVLLVNKAEVAFYIVFLLTRGRELFLPDCEEGFLVRYARIGLCTVKEH